MHSLKSEQRATEGSTVRAVETTGVVDEESRLQLDSPLPIVGPDAFA